MVCVVSRRRTWGGDHRYEAHAIETETYTYGPSDGINDGILYDSVRGSLEQDSLVREVEDTNSVTSQGFIIRDSEGLYDRHVLLPVPGPIREEVKDMHTCEHDLFQAKFPVIDLVLYFVLVTNQP